MAGSAQGRPVLLQQGACGAPAGLGLPPLCACVDSTLLLLTCSMAQQGPQRASSPPSGLPTSPTHCWCAAGCCRPAGHAQLPPLPRIVPAARLHLVHCNGTAG